LEPVLSSLCRAGCLRRDSRATAIVTAAARTASPMTWPPMSRTVSGRPAERSAVLIWCWCRPGVLGAVFGEGDTCGNTDPTLPAGFVTPGKEGLLPGSPAVGRLAVLPALPEVGVGVGVGEDEGLASTWKLEVADADLAACVEVADTVSVMAVPNVLLAVSSACVSMCCPALRPVTVHVDWPGVWQTENVGLTLLGDASTETLAVPPVPLVSQSTMSNWTVLLGSTVLPPTVCTLRHSVAVGAVLVGVGVGVAVGVGLAVGVLFVPPGEIVGVVWRGVVLADEPGLGVLLALGVTMPPPGLGFGVGGGPRLGWGDGLWLGLELGLPDAVLAAPACWPA
jgi:hypothetical protein